MSFILHPLGMSRSSPKMRDSALLFSRPRAASQRQSAATGAGGGRRGTDSKEANYLRADASAPLSGSVALQRCRFRDVDHAQLLTSRRCNRLKRPRPGLKSRELPVSLSLAAEVLHGLAPVIAMNGCRNGALPSRWPLTGRRPQTCGLFHCLPVRASFGGWRIARIVLARRASCRGAGCRLLCM